MNWLEMILIVVISLIAILGLVLIYCVISPMPTVWYLRRLFSGTEYTKLDSYEKLKEETTIYEDIDYESDFPHGKLDIIMPKQVTGKLPVIFWVHGGAYVAGDKEDITPYAISLASRGFNVVNINYALAPKGRYPIPLRQIGEAYSYIKKHFAEYHIDLNRTYFAGDSAGAQMVSQFVNIQTNPKYSQQVNLEPVVNENTIKGVLLFCGPFDLAKLTQIDSPMLRWIFDRVGWAYLGSRNWKSEEKTKEASIIDELTSNYPPAFITDGNKGSFEYHGKMLEKALKDVGVYTESVFYPQESQELGHEYQFNLGDKYGEDTFERVIEFLNKTR